MMDEDELHKALMNKNITIVFLKEISNTRINNLFLICAYCILSTLQSAKAIVFSILKFD